MLLRDVHIRGKGGGFCRSLGDYCGNSELRMFRFLVCFESRASSIANRLDESMRKGKEVSKNGFHN